MMRDEILTCTVLYHGIKTEITLNKNEIIGIVSKNQELRLDIYEQLLHEYKKIYNADDRTKKIVNETDSVIESIIKNSRLKLDEAVTFCSIGGLEEKRNCTIKLLNSFEKKKFDLLLQLISGEKISFIPELYDDLTKEQAEELSDILTENSLINTTVFTGKKETAIIDICTRLIELE